MVGEGIFIGDVQEPVYSSKGKVTGQSQGSCWKYLSLLMLVATGEYNLNHYFSCKSFLVLSLGVNAYQFNLVNGYLRDIQQMNETHLDLHSEWEEDRYKIQTLK